MKTTVALCSLLITSTMGLGQPVEVISTELRGGLQPQVAVAPNGHVHVAFGKGSSVFHTVSADGRIFSPPVKIADLDKLALRMRRGPRIAATDSTVAVTAISHTDGNLHSWTSADGGATWKTGANLNTVDRSAREGLHAMAGDGRGFVFATWLDLRVPGTALWGAGSRDGGVTWDQDRLVYSSPDGHICECCHPSAAVDGRGSVALMWRNWLGGSRDLYLTTSSDQGRTFTDARKVGTGTWKLDGCPMDGGAIAIGSDRKALAVWRREKTVFLSHTPAEEQLLSRSGVQPVVITANGAPLIFWESDGGLMIQRGASSPVRFAEKAMAASAAPLPKGGAIVVWESATTTPPTILAERIE